MSVNKLEIGKVYRADKRIYGVFDFELNKNDSFVVLDFSTTNEYAFEIKILINNKIMFDLVHVENLSNITQLSP